MQRTLTTGVAQATAVRYRFSADVECVDARCGVLSRVVVDPTGPRITHLVIEPQHHHALARLVPVGQARVDESGIRLGCSRLEYQTFQPAQEFDILPADELANLATAGTFGAVWPATRPAQTVIMYESIPDGEVELNGSDRVRTGHGWFSHLEGLIAEPGEGRVTHVIIRLGHLRHAREVVVAIGSGAQIDERGVHLTLDRHEVATLLSSDRMRER